MVRESVCGSRIEGSKTLIKKENLFASNLRDDRLEIELTEAPKHGNLRLINFNKEPVLNITRIKGKYIFKGSVRSIKNQFHEILFQMNSMKFIFSIVYD